MLPNFSSLGKARWWPPNGASFCTHVSSPSYIIIQYIDSSSVHTALQDCALPPPLNGQLWTVRVSYHGRAPPIDSTDCGLQCPVDNYSVQCATMYFQLNGLGVTYHFRPGTYIYILLTSSWCMWCIFHLKHTLTLYFIDKTSRGAFKTWNSLCSSGLTA